MSRLPKFLRAKSSINPTSNTQAYTNMAQEETRMDARGIHEALSQNNTSHETASLSGCALSSTDLAKIAQIIDLRQPTSLAAFTVQQPKIFKGDSYNNAYNFLTTFTNYGDVRGLRASEKIMFFRGCLDPDVLNRFYYKYFKNEIIPDNEKDADALLKRIIDKFHEVYLNEGEKSKVLAELISNCINPDINTSPTELHEKFVEKGTPFSQHELIPIYIASLHHDVRQHIPHHLRIKNLDEAKDAALDAHRMHKSLQSIKDDLREEFQSSGDRGNFYQQNSNRYTNHNYRNNYNNNQNRNQRYNNNNDRDNNRNGDNYNNRYQDNNDQQHDNSNNQGDYSGRGNYQKSIPRLTAPPSQSNTIRTPLNSNE